MTARPVLETTQGNHLLVVQAPTIEASGWAEQDPRRTAGYQLGLEASLSSSPGYHDTSVAQ